MDIHGYDRLSMGIYAKQRFSLCLKKNVQTHRLLLLFDGWLDILWATILQVALQSIGRSRNSPGFPGFPPEAEGGTAGPDAPSTRAGVQDDVSLNKLPQTISSRSSISSRYSRYQSSRSSTMEYPVCLPHAHASPANWIATPWTLSQTP